VVVWRLSHGATQRVARAGKQQLRLWAVQSDSAYMLGKVGKAIQRGQCDDWCAGDASASAPRGCNGIVLFRSVSAAGLKSVSE